RISSTGSRTPAWRRSTPRFSGSRKRLAASGTLSISRPRSISLAEGWIFIQPTRKPEEPLFKRIGRAFPYSLRARQAILYHCPNTSCYPQEGTPHSLSLSWGFKRAIGRVTFGLVCENKTG